MLSCIFDLWQVYIILSTYLQRLLCQGDGYVLSHKGIGYESSFGKDLEEFSQLLDPKNFFMINDFTIVSRKACKDFKELGDGTLKVDLMPSRSCPAPLGRRIGLGYLIF